MVWTSFGDDLRKGAGIERSKGRCNTVPEARWSEIQLGKGFGFCISGFEKSFEINMLGALRSRRNILVVFVLTADVWITNEAGYSRHGLAYPTCLDSWRQAEIQIEDPGTFGAGKEFHAGAELCRGGVGWITHRKFSPGAVLAVSCGHRDSGREPLQENREHCRRACSLGTSWSRR